MADSALMKRLDRLERDVGELKAAVVQITATLVDQSERMDAGFRAVREEFREEMGGLRGALTDRLDRLIAATTRERTESAERFERLIAATTRDRTENADRFAHIEQRLARLEERVGI